MSKDLVKVSVTVAGRSYPIQVEKNKQADVKKASKLINKKLLEYQKQFKGADKQDCMAMLLLTLQVDEHKEKMQSPSKDSQQYDELLTGLEKILHI